MQAAAEFLAPDGAHVKRVKYCVISICTICILPAAAAAVYLRGLSFIALSPPPPQPSAHASSRPGTSATVVSRFKSQHRSRREGDAPRWNGSPPELPPGNGHQGTHRHSPRGHTFINVQPGAAERRKTNLRSLSPTRISGFVALVYAARVRRGTGRTINKGCKVSDLTGEFKKVGQKKKRKGLEG